MTGKMHAFDGRVGGGSRMSLFYPVQEGEARARRRRAMSLTVTFDEVPDGMEVTLLFENIPPGIRPEDNELRARLSLEQLASRFE